MEQLAKVQLRLEKVFFNFYNNPKIEHLPVLMRLEFAKKQSIMSIEHQIKEDIENKEILIQVLKILKGETVN